ncbi:hypothetical protein [Acetivibrio clariflavus]|uniref:Uncharacterized protein n=1 Tax=Acetivibrio clariflavus (strain DSM 19732 / NBRC 101661 / EBR45) TaxID=720554 RepID=G8M2R5_ACECE|nr:hypothetical protein [Acetivibrio clariflavus]AEV67139.1 hypothetical protein Clocl_0410 [Acetivibrio clariflavus DSM 19732]HPU41365.1 hypothetical protein [Acetivibrio clariflavus]
MKKEIADLLSHLNSNNTEEKRYSIADIGMILEMNTRILNGNQSDLVNEEFKNYLDKKLLSIRLNIDEQVEIIEKLVERILAKDTLSASMLWAIGKAYPTAGLPGIVKVIEFNWKTFDDEMSYQSIISLENFLYWDIIRNASGELLRNEEFMTFIQEKSQSTNERLSECSKRVLSKLSGIKRT